MNKKIDSIMAKMNRREKILNEYVKIDWKKFNNSSVIDIGPAFGIWAMKAVDSGATVKAVEISNYWCKTFCAITSNIGYNIPVTECNILKYDKKEKYDIVLCLAVWHHVPEYKLLFDKIFELSKKYIYIEGPVGEETIYKKHKQYGADEQSAWYWVPTTKELIKEIEDRGGTITRMSFNKNGHRVMVEVEKR